jgi:hypothetical protein
MTRTAQRTRFVAPRGSTAGGLIAVFSILGALTATTLVVAPRYLTAAPVVVESDHVEPRTPHRRNLVQALAAVMEQSVGVVAVHDRGSTPFAEIVLWLTDEENRGVMDEWELAVMSHSRILRTVTLYRIPRDDEQAAEIADDGRVREAAFCEVLRADERVEPMILMTDVSEMQVERLADASPDRLRLAVTLTWSGESVDGADKASVIVVAGQE